MRVEPNEQLSLGRIELPLPLPGMCPGCFERDPMIDPACPICGMDYLDGTGIPF
jgi:hypothetical protein